ncbi:DNA polymerase family A-domain-containing protein [Infundibulicybe gibba]|nr:DNA polymerase family A-domain-containing protein [Infundibulicybe gibba]
MLSKIPATTSLNLLRQFHTSLRNGQTLARRFPPPKKDVRNTRATNVRKDEKTEGVALDGKAPDLVKRNELGVQLLSRRLHAQIFQNVSFPPPQKTFVQISQEHLEMHGLDPTQGSVLPDTSFDLPPLQGSNLLEHFYRIGSHAAEPWRDMAKSFTSASLPPKPDHWDIQSGWTKYHFLPDGSSYSEHVEYPMHEGKSENILTFDVETMPNYHPYAIMACAASEHAWYAWISPWLLGESDNPRQLIPLGDPHSPRLIVGHNVSYDRGRILEEYSLKATQNRFIDTMALHVAVKGISSHQRPAWMKYRKSKETAKEQQEEAREAVHDLLEDVDKRQSEEPDQVKREELRRLRQSMEESLLSSQAADGIAVDDVAEADISSKRWEDLTSANSLADVAKLHCGIEMDKEIRNDFMKLTPSEICENITEYLGYCATDVYVTHRVYAKVLPAFFVACPHPVSFAGLLTMGSSFLTVNEEWESYLARAEGVYREMEEGVKKKLQELAEGARALMVYPDENSVPKWHGDPWLAQLDWTPKVAGKSRGVFPPAPTEPEHLKEEVDSSRTTESLSPQDGTQSLWYSQLVADPFDQKVIERILPLLLRLSYDGRVLHYNYKERWHFMLDGEVTRIDSAAGKKTTQILCPRHALVYLRNQRMGSCDMDLAIDISKGDKGDNVRDRLLRLAKDTATRMEADDPWLRQLDWTLIGEDTPSDASLKVTKRATKKPKPVKPPPVYWPKWYWDATKPRKDMPPGTLDITVRNRIAPLLLRLSWLGWPLCHSREYGWTFRVPSSAGFTTRLAPLSFHDPVDDIHAEASLRGGYVYYKLPHKDGEKANVGSPLSKTFMKFAQDGTLKSPGDEAKEALDMNAQCSYWISARDRIMNQMVVWQDDKTDLGFSPPEQVDGQVKKKWGIILPQVITMGTVTRRAIEKTWLTASNAKKNRVGSELKAMVRAPEGYSIVGADVDSEELWISSCMGDAQFGLHGATALGWMTLEGTKAAGTDLHSKTASILGISRDQAKVFNYSRIYGAGMRHAVLLLLQSNPGMLPEAAQKLAENLYASTKGKNTHRGDIFERKFWFGGTESYVFNKLEEIALSDKPQTPALGCGVTYALSKEYLPAEFGADYMPSRINWVVQSSGVDYLHLLIVSMDYLIAKYNIDARYLISVHDELRYLVADEDRYRAALALQIANLWTRCMFAYRLGMDDLPQGVAFFSAVDVDKVLRKEVDMPCTTPSQPIPIPPGESLDITGVLSKTHGGSLQKDGRPMERKMTTKVLDGNLDGFSLPDCLVHRARSAAFLRAQATADFAEIKSLAQRVYGTRFSGGLGGGARKKMKRRAAPVGNGEGVNWADTVDHLMH